MQDYIDELLEEASLEYSADMDDYFSDNEADHFTAESSFL